MTMYLIRATQAGYSVLHNGRKLFGGSFRACVAFCRGRGASWECNSPPNGGR